MTVAPNDSFAIFGPTWQVFCSIFAGTFQVRCAHVWYTAYVQSTPGRLRQSVAAVGVPRAGPPYTSWSTPCHSVLEARLPISQSLRLERYGSRPIRRFAIAAGG